MTAMIEPYSGYVLAYLLVGLVCQLAFYFWFIRDDLDGKASAWQRKRIGSVKIAAFAFLAMPICFIPFLLLSTLREIWDALKAWKGFMRRESGTEELLFSAFWLYVAYIAAVEIELKTGWIFIFIPVMTSLYLMQAARAMQLLKENNRAEGQHQETP